MEKYAQRINDKKQIQKMAKVQSRTFSENASSKPKFKDSQAGEWRAHASVHTWAKGKATITTIAKGKNGAFNA